MQVGKSTEPRGVQTGSYSIDDIISLYYITMIFHTTLCIRPLPNPREPSFDDYSLNSYSQTADYRGQPSQRGDSFSVMEDDTQDRSSFIPYNNSWRDNSKQLGPAHLSSGGKAQRECLDDRSIDNIQADDGDEGQDVVSGESRMTHALLGAPVMPRNKEAERRDEVNCTMDQSYTQFDIPRSKLTAPSSTPASRKLISESMLTAVELCYKNT